jgi:hypothetical protein
MTTKDKYLLKYLKYKNKYFNLKGSSLPTNISVVDGILNNNTKRLKDRFDLLQVEIVTSYMTEFIGMYMQNIVDFYNKKFRNNVRVSGIVREDKFEGLVTSGKLNNCLVPVGLDFVHWYFIDNLNQSHNPYSYNMQILNSHQFCQTHALILAFYPEKRNKTDLKNAYKKVIENWTEILNNITPSIKDHNAIIHTLRNANKKDETYFDIICNYYLKDRNITNIINLIKSPIALDLAPNFS